MANNNNTQPQRRTVVAPKESPEQELERLRRENAELKAAKVGKVSFKISAKGAVSVYGLGRFPVTLYKEQWERVIGQIEALRSLMDKYPHALASKGIDYDYQLTADEIASGDFSDRTKTFEGNK